MLSLAGIYLFENGTTLAVKPYWKGAEKLTFFKEIGLEPFHTKELTLPRKKETKAQTLQIPKTFTRKFLTGHY